MSRTLKVNYKIWEALNKPQPIIVIIGGRGCVAPDTLLDTPNGQVRIDEFDGGEIYAMTEHGVSVVYAEKPVMFPPELLYRVSFSDGSILTCTDQHRFLSEAGWQPLSVVLRERLQICASFHPLTSLDIDPSRYAEDARHCFQTLVGFLYSYYGYCHRYGLQLPTAGDTYQGALQRLVDELRHKSHASIHAGGQEFWNTRNSLQLSRRLSSLSALLEEEVRHCEAMGSCTGERFSELLSEFSQLSQQFRGRKNLEQQVLRLCELILEIGCNSLFSGKTQEIVSDILRCDVSDSSYSDSLSCNGSTHYIAIESCVESATSEYYDLFVPIYNNYLSNGVINHNSGKSIGVGDVLTFEMDTKGYDIYCLREFQDSINDSVHRVFEGAINKRLKLDGWNIQANTVIAPNGARTAYKGASRNPDSMQSAQGYLRSWFEEAHRASQASIDKLLPTILRNPGAKCIFTANPQSSGDPFSQRFIVPYLDHIQKNGFYEDAIHYIVKVNWKDNPWWNEEQEALRKWDYENLSRAKYNWIWEGEFMDTVDNAIIAPEWFDACVDAHLKPNLGEVFKPTGAIVAALDPFDDGGDAAGYAVRHGSIIKRVACKNSGEIDEVCDWATGEAAIDRADWFIWDGDGMGTGLKGQVSSAFEGTKTEYKMFRGSLSGSAQDNAEQTYMRSDREHEIKSTYADTFLNNRSQYYSELARRMHNTYLCVAKGKYIDPDDMISLSSDGIDNLPGLRSQLCRIPTKPNSRGLVQIMSKDDMKRLHGIMSPNEADAVMMTMFKPPSIGKAKKINFKRLG